MEIQRWWPIRTGSTINNKNYCRTRQRLEAGTYYVVVKNASSGKYGEYTIKMDAAYESAEDYEQENNNVKSQANVKNPNHWYTGNLNSMDDVDCFLSLRLRTEVV